MNTHRRDFLKQTAATVAGLALSGNALWAAGESNATQAAGKSPFIWADLLHLGQNMWGDTPRAYAPPTDHFACDVPLWNELTEKMAAIGMNLVVIDLGEAVQYESHPELAISGAWTIDRLREELARLRKLGLEPIPKLNFSACHDHWLGEYSRMLSTTKYYEVCADLVREVCEIFDRPRFFHLGYDEETFANQQTHDYIVVRQGELWWHDFLFFVDAVEKEQVRPWIWSDYYWAYPEDFLKRMPKSVVQSNWYYGENFSMENSVIKAYVDLDNAGFDQIPTGSNWSNDVNFQGTVDFCQTHLSKERLLGFMQAPWHFTHPEDRDFLLRAIDQVKAAKETYKG